MLRGWNLSALLVLIGTTASTASAQPPAGRRGPDDRPGPAGNVVARVNVNVETEVDVSDGSTPGEIDDDDEDENDSKGDRDENRRSGIAELLETALRQAGPGSVIADININVETSIKVRVPGGKSATSKSPVIKAPAVEKEAARPAEEKVETPAAEPPRKKRRKKRAPAQQETTAEPRPEESSRGLALNRLKIGDTLELGVTGELASDERAKQIAQRINVGKNQTLLGMAFVGMMLPEESESLKVVQKAISSVQANATGNELSLSVAIPKETPGAVKTLVEAALEKK